MGKIVNIKSVDNTVLYPVTVSDAIVYVTPDDYMDFGILQKYIPLNDFIDNAVYKKYTVYSNYPEMSEESLSVLVNSSMRAH